MPKVIKIGVKNVLYIIVEGVGLTYDESFKFGKLSRLVTCLQ